MLDLWFGGWIEALVRLFVACMVVALVAAVPFVMAAVRIRRRLSRRLARREEGVPFGSRGILQSLIAVMDGTAFEPPKSRGQAVDQIARYPPSTTSSVPVMYDASSDARKRTA